MLFSEHAPDDQGLGPAPSQETMPFTQVEGLCQPDLKFRAF